MSKFYLNNFSEVNVYKKMSTKSEVTTQMIYGDVFSIKKRSNSWFKIKIKECLILWSNQQEKAETNSMKVCSSK